MSLITCAGADVLSARITIPLRGAWFAELEIADAGEGAKAPSGRVAISAPDVSLELSGTVVTGGRFHGRTSVQVVGGAGGLTKVLPARFYRGVQTRTVLNDTLSSGGEKLSSTSDTEITGRPVAAWSRPFGPISATLEAVTARTSGACWRTLRAGDVWIGVPQFGATNLEIEYRDQDFDLKTFDFAADIMSLDPNVMLDGRKIVQVQYSLTGNGLRGTAWYE